MRYDTALAITMAASAAAFPGMSKQAMLDEMKNQKMEKREPTPVANPEPSLISGLLGTVTGIVGGVTSGVPVVDDLTQIVDGLLASAGNTVEALLGDNLRPEPGYEFIAPGPNDSRGPCPGLNLLANYGYLPRNGLVNYEQVLDATSRGFNMGADLATVLAVFAILSDGDIATESWYLGTDPNTNVGGLNRHSTVEADVSPNREDYYLGCGDNHHLSSRLFKQNVAYAAADDGTFNMKVMGDQYVQLASFSKQYNPYLYYFPFPLIVSSAAFAFYPNFFSNGTYGLGGVPNYESISNIIGAEYDSSTGEFNYVPEKWPENWYRRSIPYTAAQALTDGLVDIYARNIITPGVSEVGTPNFNVSSVLCNVYMGINSITPLLVAGDEADVAAAASWALGKLDAAFPLNSFLGCSADSVSPNYPNADQLGGPENPGPADGNWVGNNVYGKAYFTGGAPTTPQCSH